MDIRLDHVVLWVADPLRAVGFYADVLGFEGVRVEEFRAGKAPFPSVRVSADLILDLMPQTMAPIINSMPGAAGSAGNKVNHLCFSMSRSDYERVKGKLEAHGSKVGHTMKDSFGAQGFAPDAFYFPDLDGNVIEARTYE
jgi:glyoxylase I family protein